MTSRTVKRLYDLEIDEVSLVDRPANQHGVVAIAKRAEEYRMPVYDAEGYEVDEDSLEVGDVVYTDDGTEHVMLDPETAAELGYTDEDVVADDGGTAYDVEDSYEPEFAGVGKAFPGNSFRSQAKDIAQSGRRKVKRHGVDVGSGAAGGAVAGFAARGKRGEAKKSLGSQVLEELSKALGDSDRDEVISKLGDMVQDSREEANEAWRIAKALLDERDNAAYTELATQYDLPVDPGHLGRVLKRASESLPEADVALLDRALTAAGAAQFNEIGYNGYQDSDVMGQVAALAGQAVTKNDLSQEQAVVALFEANPAAYDEYLSESR